jgi:hypothetical protein
MHIRTRRLAKRLADTEFDSGWKALSGARSNVLTACQRVFLLRVSADEFRHSTLFSNLASQEARMSEIASSTQVLAGAAATDRRLFADLVVGETMARLAFWLYRRAWSELIQQLPEFTAIEADEAFHRFGALLHLRRICGSRIAVLRALRLAKLRLCWSALCVAGAEVLGTVGRWLATGVLLMFWPILARHAKARLTARISK